MAVEQTGWTMTWIALAFLALAFTALLAVLGTEWWIPGSSCSSLACSSLAGGPRCGP